MSRSPIGQRIRNRRREQRMTQAALATAAGISPSYLNLIEHDKRMIGGALMKRIAETLAIPVSDLSGTDDFRLTQELLDIVRSLAMLDLRPDDAVDLVARSPAWVTAFIRLHSAYRHAADTAGALSDRLSQDPTLMELSHAVLNRVTEIRSFAEILASHSDLSEPERLRFSQIVADQSTLLAAGAREMISLLSGPAGTAHSASPREEVDDFIHRHGNHFPAVEDAAERLRLGLGTSGGSLAAAIRDRLDRLEADAAPPEDAATAAADGADPGQDLPGATVRFRAARRLVEHELGELLDETVDDRHLTTEEARSQARGAIASYAAGALLFPYAPFLEAAEVLRYDIDRLGARFAGSYEQVAHRLVTLHRRDAAGVPFAFVRADPGGNLSKPFGVPGLRMPRFGGACPLWALYAALAVPDRPVVQLAVMPEGERFVFVARRVVKRLPAFGVAPVVFSIMLGCDTAYADRIVYADALAGGTRALEEPVGHTCRSCPRRCAQRAHDPILLNRPQAEPGASAGV